MIWRIVFAKQAIKDAKKLSANGLKQKAQERLVILEKNPFQNPPPYEKLVGDLAGAYSDESIFNTVSFMKYTFRKKSFVFCECGRIMNEPKLKTFFVVVKLKVNLPNSTLKPTRSRQTPRATRSLL